MIALLSVTGLIVFAGRPIQMGATFAEVYLRLASRLPAVHRPGRVEPGGYEIL